MEIGTYVRYATEPIDMVWGIVEKYNCQTGFVFVRWIDNFADWYNPIGLIKL